jgi:hypothetical protein
VIAHTFVSELEQQKKKKECQKEGERRTHTHIHTYTFRYTANGRAQRKNSHKKTQDTTDKYDPPLFFFLSADAFASSWYKTNIIIIRY